MSHCMECGKEMDRCEAMEYEACRECRKATKNYRRVRTLNRKGTEATGRKARDTKVIGGSADLDPNHEHHFGEPKQEDSQ